MSTNRFGTGVAILVALAMAGCGGGGGGDASAPAPVAVPAGPPVTVPTGTSPVTLTVNTPAATFAALAPKVTVGTVTIASPPVVHFSMTDVDGNAIIGFGSASKSSSAAVASYPNLSFSLAKLVPGSNGSPSKWVSYIVTTVPTVSVPTVYPTRPSTDNTGTLVDHNDGTYTYTFYRDITKISDTVRDAADPPADVNNAAGANKADLGDLTYDPSLVHRLTIQVSGNVPGTGTNTPTGVQTTTGVPMLHPVDVIYDFIPATGQPVTAADPSRDIVSTSKCNECHAQLGGIPGDSPESSGAGFHGGNRNETRYCVVCHTEQRKYGRKEATLDSTGTTFVKPADTKGCGNNTVNCTYVFNGRAIGNLPNHIHKIHMGEHLVKQGYEYGGLLYNETKFPQDLRNCTKCHDGSATSTAKTAQGDNWMNVPNRIACGGCHDGINFATGKGVTIADAAKGLTSSPFGHVGGIQTDDSLCALCHKPSVIDVAHLPVTPPNPTNALLDHSTDGVTANSNTNAAWIASNTSRLPAGAIKVAYDIKSVSVAPATVNGQAVSQPVMVFRMLQNGTPVAFNDPTKTSEIWDNFMGSPSVYFVFSVPQDGIAAPADFNATVNGYLRSIWNGTSTNSGKGTLSGPDADGYYTVTLTGVSIPASAKMLTGGLGYSYSVLTTLPLTQTNLDDYPVANATATTGLTAGMPNKTGGLIVIAPNAQKVATGFTGRRAVVEDARCNKCHQELGTFTEDAFHAGQRNDGTTCAWCHRPNQTSSGWAADSTSYIHAIHASAKREKPFTWHASTTTESFADIKFPGILAQCETCHLPGTYDFSATASADALPNRLYRTVATGIFPALGTTIPGYKVSSGACVAGTPSVGTALSVFSLSPYVAQSTTGSVTNYGIGFSFNPGLSASPACAPDGTLYSVAAGSSVAANPASLVNSPIATACFACHDSSLAMSHMVTNGGSLYAPRATALGIGEQCTLCHASGKVADIKVMHSK